MSGERPRRIPWRLSRKEIRSAVDSEIEFHLAARVEELTGEGYSPAEARAEALRRFGDVEETRAVCTSADARRARRRSRAEQSGELLQDARHGLRQLRRRPGFAAVAVLTLGLGIGANAAIFAAVDHVLLRELPYRDADRIVTLWETDERTGDRNKEASPGNYLDVRERSGSFAAMGLVEPYAYDVLSEGAPESVPAWLVSEGWFEALAVVPLLGRLFVSSDYQPTPQVVLISEGYWQRRFGGAADVIGRTLRLDEGPFQIVGVLRHAQMYPEQRDLWVPKSLTGQEATDRRSAYMPAVARLNPGTDITAAQAELDAIARDLRQTHPQTNAATGFNLVRLEDHLLGPVRPALLILVAAVAFLLLIACTNLASLQLARGAERKRELSVRAALGAGRGRLVRQLITESAVLAVFGGAAGLLLAHVAIRFIARAQPAGSLLPEAMGIDLRVLAFLVGVTVLAGLLFGALPAVRTSRPDLMGPLRRGRPEVAPQRLRGALVTLEIAVALTLLVGAGLLAQSFLKLTSNDLGFAHEQRAYLQTFIWDRNPTPEERIQRIAGMRERLAALPAVHAAAAVSALPFHPHAITAQGGIRFEDQPAPPSAELPRVFTTVVTAGYFGVMGIEVVAGREFDAHDREGAPAVAVVNESFVRTHYGGEDAIGRRIIAGVMSAPQTREIVGVVRDVRATAYDADVRPELYVPHAQHGSGSMTFVVRGSRGTPPLPVLQAAVRQVDPQQTFYSSGTMTGLVAQTLTERRFQLLIVGLISLIAFLLAMMGVYGVLSVWARARTQEIGVRMALGARASEVIMLVVRQALRLTLPGILAGIAGAALFGRAMRQVLYETSPAEPLIYAQLAVLVLLTAGVAAWLPAWRTLRQDPLKALRSE